jgi:hypothetical protein
LNWSPAFLTKLGSHSHYDGACASIVLDAVVIPNPAFGINRRQRNISSNASIVNGMLGRRHDIVDRLAAAVAEIFLLLHENQIQFETYIDCYSEKNWRTFEIPQSVGRAVC